MRSDKKKKKITSFGQDVANVSVLTFAVEREGLTLIVDADDVATENMYNPVICATDTG